MIFRYFFDRKISCLASFGLQVFRKGSPLVPDISQAILSVTEGHKMTEIENAWFPSETNCPDSTHSNSSNRLGLDSFWGLFLIVGVAAVLALLIYMVMFIKRNWHVITSSSGSFWEKTIALGRQFHQRDLNAHTFRKARFRDRSMEDGGNVTATIETLEDSNFQPSPSSDSSQIDNVLTNEQGSPSAEQGLSNHVDERCPKIAINVELTNVNC